MLKKPLTLNQTWTLCLRMWRWIARNWKLGGDVNYLKKQWLRLNGYKKTSNRPEGNCFFCDYSTQKGNDSCLDCPAVLVDSEFSCFDPRYNFEYKPKEFYQKLLELNRIRKQKKNHRWYGWVLFCNANEGYVSLDNDPNMRLRDAGVYNNRKEARDAKGDCDVVRQVYLTKTGKPKKIIGRG